MVAVMATPGPFQAAFSCATSTPTPVLHPPARPFGVPFWAHPRGVTTTGTPLSPSIGGSCHTRKGFFKFADQVVPPPAPFPLHREWTRERAPFQGEGARLSITD